MDFDDAKKSYEWTLVISILCSSVSALSIMFFLAKLLGVYDHWYTMLPFSIVAFPILSAVIYYPLILPIHVMGAVISIARDMKKQTFGYEVDGDINSEKSMPNPLDINSQASNTSDNPPRQGTRRYKID